MSVSLPVISADTNHEIRFRQVQIENTGRCNMHCHHCRIAHRARKDLAPEQIVKVLDFAARHCTDDCEIVLSGGEPLMDEHFEGTLRSIRNAGFNTLVLTTNGLLLDEEHLRMIKDIAFPRFVLSVSLDSADHEAHDSFCECSGAFAGVSEALRLLLNSGIPGVAGAIRATIMPSQMNEMEGLAKHAEQFGCERISFSYIQPTGRAKGRAHMQMTKAQKLEFLRLVHDLDVKYNPLVVATNDPLLCHLDGEGDYELGDDEMVGFAHCGAGVNTFFVNAAGVMTPCALLERGILNITDLTVDEIAEQYQKSAVVQQLLALPPTLRCASCQKKC